MKKMVTGLLIVLLMFLAFAPAVSAANNGRGGFMGFISGCCFGIRSGAAYNDGKELHWREWATIIPIVGLVVGIMNGMTCSAGTTTAELAKQYGAVYY